jgi:hypothetical protein
VPTFWLFGFAFAGLSSFGGFVVWLFLDVFGCIVRYLATLALIPIDVCMSPKSNQAWVKNDYGQKIVKDSVDEKREEG